MTIFGQMTKFLDRILTNFWQNLVKFWLFWQILDIDKTWTKFGQMLDKTWTFVQNLSKFCPTLHSTGAPYHANVSKFSKGYGLYHEMNLEFLMHSFQRRTICHWFKEMSVSANYGDVVSSHDAAMIQNWRTCRK